MAKKYIGEAFASLFIPGLGQLIKGHKKKGFTLMIAQFGGMIASIILFFTLIGIPIAILIWFVLPIVHIYDIVDAAISNSQELFKF
jgi:hypothetical protein